jgi:hypothetical protein
VRNRRHLANYERNGSGGQSFNAACVRTALPIIGPIRSITFGRYWRRQRWRLRTNHGDPVYRKMEISLAPNPIHRRDGSENISLDRLDALLLRR